MSEPKLDPMERLPIEGLLDVLSVPREGLFARRLSTKGRSLQRDTFWRRHAGQLDVALHEIFLCYQRTLRRQHIWAGGNRDNYQTAIKAWKRVEHLFALRGVTL